MTEEEKRLHNMIDNLKIKVKDQQEEIDFLNQTIVEIEERNGNL